MTPMGPLAVSASRFVPELLHDLALLESEFNSICMISDPGRLPARPPLQYRSRRTLERIVRASLDILDTEGAQGLTVQAIVDRADSSVGSFYARFDGKADLIEYLGARVWDEALDRWNEALASRDWSGLDLGQMAEGSIQLLVDAYRSRATFLRSLDEVAGAGDRAWEAFRDELVRGISGLLLERAAEIDHARPELAVRLGLFAVLGVLSAVDLEDEEALPRATLIVEVRDLLMSYLCPTAPSPQDAEGVDFFHIWE